MPSARKRRWSIGLGQLFFYCADGLARLGARAVAACFRQDEFDADRGAAALCGSAPIQTALMKLESLDKLTGRLPWSERVAQFQSGGRYSEWLANELATVAYDREHEAPSHRYSTHPSIKERLAALESVPASRQVPAHVRLGARRRLALIAGRGHNPASASRRKPRWTYSNFCETYPMRAGWSLW